MPSLGFFSSSYTLKLLIIIFIVASSMTLIMAEWGGDRGGFGRGFGDRGRSSDRGCGRRRVGCRGEEGKRVPVTKLFIAVEEWVLVMLAAVTKRRLWPRLLFRWPNIMVSKQTRTMDVHYLTKIFFYLELVDHCCKVVYANCFIKPYSQNWSGVTKYSPPSHSLLHMVETWLSLD